MQHIGIRLVNQQNKTKIDVSDKLNFADLLKHLLKKENYETLQSKYPWIMSVDPYGNTYLNYLQVPYLVAELKTISVQNTKEERAFLEPFILFFEDKIIERNRLLIKFIGD